MVSLCSEYAMAQTDQNLPHMQHEHSILHAASVPTVQSSMLKPGMRAWKSSATLQHTEREPESSMRHPGMRAWTSAAALQHTHTQPQPLREREGEPQSLKGTQPTLGRATSIINYRRQQSMSKRRLSQQLQSTEGTPAGALRANLLTWLVRDGNSNQTWLSLVFGIEKVLRMTWISYAMCVCVCVCVCVCARARLCVCAYMYVYIL